MKKTGIRLNTTYGESGIHEDWRGVYRSDPRQHRFDEAIYAWLFEKLRPVGRWLDAGCGSGEHTVRLAGRSEGVLAIDVSPYAVNLAQQNVESCGLAGLVQVRCCGLEDASETGAVDHAHCRGVLMHVPEWRSALANICRAVRPGGYVVLFEGNFHSLEALLVRLVRRVQRRRSRMTRTEDGLEFWSERDGRPFLVRMTDRAILEREMRANDVVPLFSRTTALVDLNRFPARLRSSISVLNQLWYRFNLPFGSGFLIVGRKQS
jgi:SAM-dependent methyltransferase